MLPVSLIGTKSSTVISFISLLLLISRLYTPTGLTSLVQNMDLMIGYLSAKQARQAARGITEASGILLF